MPSPTPFFKQIAAVRTGEYSSTLYGIDIDGRVFQWRSVHDDVNTNAGSVVTPSSHMEWVPLLNPGDEIRSRSSLGG